jgi:hypothetical protein
MPARPQHSNLNLNDLAKSGLVQAMIQMLPPVVLFKTFANKTKDVTAIHDKELPSNLPGSAQSTPVHPCCLSLNYRRLVVSVHTPLKQHCRLPTCYQPSFQVSKGGPSAVAGVDGGVHLNA